MLCELARRTGWCILCYQGRKGKAFHRGHAYHSRRACTRKVGVTVGMKKPEALTQPKLLGVPAASDDVAGKMIPSLVEWLTEVVWDDGSKRQTGTVMVLAEDGVFKAWLNDRAMNRSCWLSAESLEALLVRVEDTLACGKGEWRVNKKQGK